MPPTATSPSMLRASNATFSAFFSFRGGSLKQTNYVFMIHVFHNLRSEALPLPIPAFLHLLSQASSKVIHKLHSFGMYFAAPETGSHLFPDMLFGEPKYLRLSFNCLCNQIADIFTFVCFHVSA